MAGSRVIASGGGTTTKEKHERHEQEQAAIERADSGMIDDTVSGVPLIQTPGLDEIVLSAAPGDLGDLFDPDAVLGTRFSGPILSGPMDGGAAGTAILSKRAKVTFANGSFSGLPIVFPASTILINLVTQLQQTFNGTTPKLNLGTTPGGLDVASIDLSVAPTQLNQNLTTILGSTWTIYLSLVLGGSTAGKATGIILYSVPALARPS
jgi:hypothetical protein